MPYKNREDKVIYQREYMRKLRSGVRPPLDPVRPIEEKLSKVGLGFKDGKVVLSNRPIKTEAPVYDPHIHKKGDLVRIFRGGRWVEMTVPELDLDGNELQEGICR